MKYQTTVSAVVYTARDRVPMDQERRLSRMFSFSSGEGISSMEGGQVEFGKVLFSVKVAHVPLLNPLRYPIAKRMSKSWST